MPWELSFGAFLLFVLSVFGHRSRQIIPSLQTSRRSFLIATLVRCAYSGIIPWKQKNDCVQQVQIWLYNVSFSFKQILHKFFPFLSFFWLLISKFERLKHTSSAHVNCLFLCVCSGVDLAVGLGFSPPCKCQRSKPPKPDSASLQTHTHTGWYKNTQTGCTQAHVSQLLEDKWCRRRRANHKAKEGCNEKAGKHNLRRDIKRESNALFCL